MKIGVVTITNGSYNYGNLLQNYAVLEVLKKMGHQAETIYNVANAEHLVSIKHKIKNIVLSITGFGNSLLAKRELNFLRFTNKAINYSNLVKNNVPEEMLLQYDYFVVGSDQVWNPRFTSSEYHWKYLLLDCVPSEKRIAYAPSIGLSQLPIEYCDSFRENVSKYKALSVREEAGASIIKELTGRDAEVLIDPTLMLDAFEWDKIAEKPKRINCNKKYILTYFLGGRNEHVNVELERYKKEGYEVYNLLDISQPNVYVTSPSNFLYLVSHAQLIMTDSFHACVFSFLYEKPFLVYNRKDSEVNMTSRLDTLLTKFHLQHKYVGSGLSNNIFGHDYSVGKKTLQAEREKVKRFLEKSIGD